jgi:uncharacterized membrane protein
MTVELSGLGIRSFESWSLLALSEPAVFSVFFLFWRNWIEPKESSVARCPRQALS